ncbi:MAG: CHAT domain-containing protein, partial [Bacteroidota bacterium]
LRGEIPRERRPGAAVAEAEDGLHGAEILGDSASVVSERSRLFTARQDYQNHLVDIERKYPAYSAWKNRDYLPTVKAVQEKLLDEHTALVSILVTGVRTSAFVITQKDIRYHTCHTCEVYNSRKLRPVLDTLLHSLKPQLEVPDSVQFQRLIASATTLYDSLLRVPLSHLGDSIDRLIIIPDDFLSQDVPFELLGDYSAWKNKPPVSFAEFPFLLKKYTVQYAPSCNLLLYQMEQKREKAPRLFAGFAPKYESSDTLAPLLASRSALVRDGLYDLPGAREEVQTIASMTHGNIFLDRSASETSFKSEAENYRILHLAAHSLLDENNPNFSRLLLSHTPGDTSEDNNLNAVELQNLHLRADLAVLSACNTGTGLLKPGEG